MFFLYPVVHLTKWAEGEKIFYPDYPASRQLRQNFHRNQSDLKVRSSNLCFLLLFRNLPNMFWAPTAPGVVTQGINMLPGVHRLHWQGFLTFSHMGGWTQLHRHWWIRTTASSDFSQRVVNSVSHKWRLYIIHVPF